MTLYLAGVLLLKITLLLAAALCALGLMRRATAQMRHLLCSTAMAGAVLIPATLVFAPPRIAIRIPVVFTATAAAGATSHAALTLFAPLLTLWFLGAIFLLLRIGAGYLRIGRALQTAQPLSLPSPVPVYAADVSVPLITGLLRPVILLPRSAAESWPPSQLDAALRHELTHLERHDLWTALIAHLACAVYWFHPLVWILAGRLRHEQETACDDAVVHSGFEAVSYAEALVAAARHVTSTPLIGCPMITKTTETSLKSRIARLLDQSITRASSPATIRRAVIVFAAMLVAIAMLNADPQDADGKTPSGGQIRIYKMADGIAPPRVLAKVDPVYTEEARAAKISGPVLLSVVVGTDGIAHDINVVNGIGWGLDEKAVEAVQKWHFQPGTLNGEPVAVRAQIEVNFKLL